ncbi:alpha/beta fold hydrolase [Saccharopolyspora griseoalba]|uniref:Alpha/beta fold hydrolase n=1 Tax=Saccharopolyspora griseoalba TaxID=1431848 RepID=A0ABW2LM80_9PSEU
MIVLVPGMLCDADLWSDLVEGLPGPVVHAAITADSVGGMAEQVLSSVDGEFSLIGLSLGAIVGFEVARRAPQRLRSLHALSTNAGPPRPEQLAGWTELAERTRAGQFAEVVAERILPAMFADPSPPRARRERFLAMADRIGPEVFRAQLAAQATRVGAFDAIAALPAPVQVLCGDRDALCPPEFHRDIARSAGGGEPHVLAGAGHLLPVERPAVVGALLRGNLPARATSGGGA